MAKTVIVYDILISCPGDVRCFVEKLENAISKFNDFYGRENDIVLRTLSCTKNAFSQFGKHPQKILNGQIVDKADFAVAVFWTRFGTKTDEYDSGTEEEIERMLDEGKQVFLYFLNKPVNLSKIDLRQYARIQKFKEKYKDNGLYFDVDNENDLSIMFQEHLKLFIASYIRGVQLSETKRNRLILWVDDNPEKKASTRNILENYGLKFDLVLSTEGAIQQMRKYCYSLVISDMGRTDGHREGYVLLQKIRASGNNVPFIIFSRDGHRPEHKLEAEKNGAQGSTGIAQEMIDMVLRQLINT